MNKNKNTEIEKIIRKYRALLPLYIIALYFIMFFLEFYIYGNIEDGIMTPSLGTLILVVMLCIFLLGCLSSVAKALQGQDGNKDTEL